MKLKESDKHSRKFTFSIRAMYEIILRVSENRKQSSTATVQCLRRRTNLYCERKKPTTVFGETSETRTAKSISDLSHIVPQVIVIRCLEDPIDRPHHRGTTLAPRVDYAFHTTIRWNGNELIGDSLSSRMRSRIKRGARDSFAL